MGPADDEGLTPNQRQAAILMGGGLTAEEAAEQLGLHPATVYKWLANGPGPQMRALIRQYADHAAEDLYALATKRLRKILEHGDDREALDAARTAEKRLANIERRRIQYDRMALQERMAREGLALPGDGQPMILYAPVAWRPEEAPRRD